MLTVSTSHIEKREICLASLWITRAEFVREYEKIEDFWFPVKDEIFVDVKLYGRKTLTIEHRIDSINDAKIVVTELRGVPTVEFAAATVARACTLDPLRSAKLLTLLRYRQR